MRRDDVIIEVTSAFLGGGDEPATWAAFSFDAGYRTACEDAAKLAESRSYLNIAAAIRKLEPSNLASEQEAAKEGNKL